MSMNSGNIILLRLTEQLNCIGRLSANEKDLLRRTLRRTQPPVGSAAAAVKELMKIVRDLKAALKSEPRFLDDLPEPLRADLAFYFIELSGSSEPTRMKEDNG